MQIAYRKQAKKYIEALDRQTKQRIKAGIEGLLKEPPEGDIKTLQGLNDGSRRLRIGGYRVIFRIVRETLFIDKVDARGGIYK